MTIYQLADFIVFLKFAFSNNAIHQCKISNKNREHIKTSHDFLSQDVFIFDEYIRFSRYLHFS